MKIILFVLLFLPAVLWGNSFSKLEAYLFNRASSDPNMLTESFVLQKEGTILFERYDHGGPQTRRLLWSMSKSVTSLIFGAVQDRGHVHLDDLASKYLPKVQNEKLKLRHLLQMSSGLEWQELYEEDPFNSHVVRMLYLESAKSATDYVLARPFIAEPGSRFYYSSGDTNVLTGALKQALPPELQNDYPWKWFFDPMEIDAVFEQDGSGVFMGSSHLYLKTKDLLKIGQLIVDRGMYRGKQIVSKSYIDFATSLADSMRSGECLKDEKMTYGAAFWLNHPCPDGRRPFPSVLASMIMMLGHEGQSVFIFPDEKIVAVRIARDRGQVLDKEKYARLILEAVGED